MFEHDRSFRVYQESDLPFLNSEIYYHVVFLSKHDEIEHRINTGMQ